MGHPDHSWMKINIFRHIVTSCIHSLSWDTGQGANLSTIFGLLGLICATNMGKALLTAGLPSQPPKDPLSLAGECVYLGMNFVPYGLQVCHHLNLSSSTFFKLPFLCPVFLFSSSSHRNAAVPHRLNWNLRAGTWQNTCKLAIWRQSLLKTLVTLLPLLQISDICVARINPSWSKLPGCLWEAGLEHSLHIECQKLQPAVKASKILTDNLWGRDWE